MDAFWNVTHKLHLCHILQYRLCRASEPAKNAVNFHLNLTFVRQALNTLNGKGPPVELSADCNFNVGELLTTL